MVIIGLVSYIFFRIFDCQFWSSVAAALLSRLKLLCFLEFFREPFLCPELLRSLISDLSSLTKLQRLFKRSSTCWMEIGWSDSSKFEWLWLGVRILPVVLLSFNFSFFSSKELGVCGALVLLLAFNLGFSLFCKE